MYYFYVLENKQGELYFGSTNDLRRRVSEHQGKYAYATRKGMWSLVYYEAYGSEKDARTREMRIKHHGQAKRQLKERIINSRRGQS